MPDIIVRAGGDDFEDVTITAGARFRVVYDDRGRDYPMPGEFSAADACLATLARLIDDTVGTTWWQRMYYPIRRAMYRAERDGRAVYVYQRHDNQRYGRRAYRIERVDARVP